MLPSRKTRGLGGSICTVDSENGYGRGMEFNPGSNQSIRTAAGKNRCRHSVIGKMDTGNAFIDEKDYGGEREHVLSIVSGTSEGAGGGERQTKEKTSKVGMQMLRKCEGTGGAAPCAGMWGGTQHKTKSLVGGKKGEREMGRRNWGTAGGGESNRGTTAPKTFGWQPIARKLQEKGRKKNIETTFLRNGGKRVPSVRITQVRDGDGPSTYAVVS